MGVNSISSSDSTENSFQRLLIRFAPLAFFSWSDSWSTSWIPALLTYDNRPLFDVTLCDNLWQSDNLAILSFYCKNTQEDLILLSLVEISLFSLPFAHSCIMMTLPFFITNRLILFSSQYFTGKSVMYLFVRETVGWYSVSPFFLSFFLYLFLSSPLSLSFSLSLSVSLSLLLSASLSVSSAIQSSHYPIILISWVCKSRDRKILHQIRLELFKTLE